MFRKNYDVQKYFVQVMGIMHENGELGRIKRTRCNMHIKLAKVFNVFLTLPGLGGGVTLVGLRPQTF